MELTQAIQRASAWKDVFLIPATGPLYYVRKVYEWIVLTPLARLYINGPSWGSFGFWNGQSLSDICAQKTSLDATFWQANPMECAQIISKNFYAMVISVETLMYFALLWITIRSLFDCIIHHRMKNSDVESDKKNDKKNGKSEVEGLRPVEIQHQ